MGKGFRGKDSGQMIMYFHYLISKIEKNPEISSRCISYNTMQVLKAKSSFLRAIILD